MKRAIAAGALALTALALGPAVSTANHSNGGPSENPRHDFATGGGITGVETRFGFAAHQGPNGPNGHATFKNFVSPLTADRRGPVVCLSVQGNRAVFGVEDRESNPNGTIFREFFVEDNGEPQAGQPVDRITQVTVSQTRPPEQCRTPVPLGTIFARPLVAGNITVHDGPQP